MTLPLITQFFAWCTLINFAILILATIGIYAMGDFAKRVHSRMFGIDPADLPAIYFKYLAYYKIAVLVFNLAPYLALRIIA